ncbi:MAG: potassium/proton antiporter [Butyricicoccaceae bacterium]
MTTMLLMSALLILACLFAQRLSVKIGLPSLLLFMVLGMLCGSDGILNIEFQNYQLTQNVSAIALVFIMFYGGFCTNWSTAKPVAVKAVLLSTAGVLVTAGLVCVFCHYVLRFPLIESFLIGAVISSTDAASVFSILRSKNLSLRYGTASILEIESGSNDPMSYMLTIIGLSMLRGEQVSAPLLVVREMAFGILIGVLIALVAVYVLNRFHYMMNDGMDTIFVIALVLISYSLPSTIGGNGYLSVYLTGIVLGNHKIRNKVSLVHFFGSMTGLSQFVLFFLLGLLSFPHKIPQVFVPALFIALFLTFVARPIAVFLLMLPARCNIRQCLLLSWSGLRGAASIVFAVIVIASGVSLESDLFHIVFLISLLSVSVQGTLLPMVAEKLGMVDDEASITKTFNDYQEESSITMMRMFIPKGHNWENKLISEVAMPTGSLALMIRRGEETIIPKGDTRILAGDSVILSVPSYDVKDEVNLLEIPIERGHAWSGRCIEDLDLPDNILIVLIKRGAENIIPRGKTMIQEDDVLVMYQ